MYTLDVVHETDLARILPLADELNCRQILICGSVTDDMLVMSKERPDLDVRFWSGKTFRHVNSGITAGHDEDGNWIIVVRMAGEPADSGRFPMRSLSPSHPLLLSLDVAVDAWDSAAPVSTSQALPVGSMVRVLASGDIGRIESSQRHADQFMYVVTVNGHRRNIPGDAVEEHDGGDDPRHWVSHKPASVDDISMAMTTAKLTHPLTDVFYSFRATNTLFRPYQFRPLMKILNSDRRRLLIADEVGLGKTIEAGLIWTELVQRSEVRQALVVCPAMLRFKWQQEMQTRFGRHLKVWTKEDLAAWVSELEQGVDEPRNAIISLEMFRSYRDHLERLEVLSPHLDLVIVDEAHSMRNVQTASNRLGSLLSEWADTLLFLSATPLNLSRDDLFNLLHLLDEERFSSAQVLDEQMEPNRLINSASRALLSADVNFAEALAHIDRITDSSYGRQLIDDPDLRSVQSALRDAVAGPDSRSSVDVSAILRRLMEVHTLAPVFTRTRKVDTPERKAEREVRSLHVDWSTTEQDYYEAIRELHRELASGANLPSGFIMQMPLRQAASCLAATHERLHERLDSQATLEEDDEWNLRNVYDRLSPELQARLARAPQVDRKLDAFVPALHESLRLGSGQAIVFSFFRRTLAYLSTRLREAGVQCQVLDGGTPINQRQQIIDAFRAGDFDVLLSSEVGSEGLDFQFCNVLFNYDLPWNPMRVEQRIGRLDRFGQKSEKVFIHNFEIPGTIESDIISRLYERIGVFKDTIGDLEPILRDLEHDLSVALDPSLSPEQLRQKAHQLEVALGNRKAQIEQLEEGGDVLLAGVDSLLIDGFTPESPGRGRFIGSEELIRVVSHFMRRFNGGLDHEQRGDHDFLRLWGGNDLARELRALDGGATVAADLEHEGHLVTLDPEIAARQGVTLLGVAHPILLLTKRYLKENLDSLARFGVVSCPDVTQPALVGLFLEEKRGIRPSMTLSTTAVSIQGNELPGVGDAVLSALAEGSLGPGQLPDPSVPLAQLWKQIMHMNGARVIADDAEHRAQNQAVVDRWVFAREREYNLKLIREREKLGRMKETKGDARIVRMVEGRIRNLEARKHRQLEELESQREASVMSSELAVLWVTP